MSGLFSGAGSGGDLALAACLLAVDPCGLGGVSLRVAYGGPGDDFLKLLRQLMPVGAPFRRIPLQIADSRLLGGLDLAATLQAGRPVLERGLLAEADGGCIVLPMAERLSRSMAARLCATIDRREVTVERDGFTCRHVTRLAFIALDEGASEDERPPSALLDRLAMHLSPEPLQNRDSFDSPFNASDIEAARSFLSRVTVSDDMVKAFCHAALAIGVASIRAPIFAAKLAAVHAALSGRLHTSDADAIVASRLVLAPRATALPVPAPDDVVSDQSDEQDSKEDEYSSDPSGSEGKDNEASAAKVDELEDVVIEAARAAIPPHILAKLQTSPTTQKNATTSGRAGTQLVPAQRGRPSGTRRGELKSGARLNVLETLRAAAPWQKLRRQRFDNGRLQVHRDDFRLTRFKHRSETATVFVVDASGSSALHRLAEAKGAVELLLADCYVRRDQVALIAFRGKAAELILPPTRSLARAKRSLSSLPGGGGTPIAAALEAAAMLADGLRRKGLAPTIVLLTDGRANVARDGVGGRQRAEDDALSAARSCRASRLAVLLVDTSPTPGPAAERLAAEMGARYLPLPRADAFAISRVVQNMTSLGPAAKAG